MEDWRLNAIRQLITFVKFRLNVSSKRTTAANVQLTESLLDNCLKNKNIAVNIRYYLRSRFASSFFFKNFSFQNLFLNCKKTEKNIILWQRTKTRTFLSRVNIWRATYAVRIRETTPSLAAL